MSPKVWSFVLSWTRIATNTLLFLIATRVLSLEQIGAFALAFAPIRLAQALLRSGFGDAAIVLGKTAKRRDQIFYISVGTAGLITVTLLVIGLWSSVNLVLLASIPAMLGLSVTAEAELKKSMRIKELAIRVLIAQSIAMMVSLLLLWLGFGILSLIAFAVLNTLISVSYTLMLAGHIPQKKPSLSAIKRLLPAIANIAQRALLNASLFPLAQLMIGLILGQAAAGAFQIATRIAELIEALTLSPLRYLALAELSARTPTEINATLKKQMAVCAPLAAWAWGGAYIAAGIICAIAAGSTHGPAVAPILRGLALWGLFSALTMPFQQALTARGQAKTLASFTRQHILLMTVLLSCAAMYFGTASSASFAISAAGAWIFWRCHNEIQRARMAPIQIGRVISLSLFGAGIMMLTLWLLSPGTLAANIAMGSAAFLIAIICSNAILPIKEWRDL